MRRTTVEGHGAVRFHVGARLIVSYDEGRGM